MFKRTDSGEPTTEGVQLWIGDDADSWARNEPCNSQISMRRRRPTVSNCEGIGRYPFVVIRARSAILSLLDMDLDVRMQGLAGARRVLAILLEFNA